MNHPRSWKYEVAIKDLLSNDNDQSAAKAIGQRIAKRVRLFVKNRSNFHEDFNLDEIIENLECINSVETWEELCAEDSSWEPEPPITELNGRLAELYDWCDDNRVWVK